MRWSYLLSLVAACGGKAAEEPAQIGPPPPPPPARCPDVTYACIDPAVGCAEGGDDFKAAYSCKKLGGIEGTACDSAGTLGSCTTIGGAFYGCSTLWVKKGLNLQTPDDGKAACAKAHGNWVSSPGT